MARGGRDGKRPTGAAWACAALVIAASCVSEPGAWVVESGDIGSQGGATSVFEPYGDVGGPIGPGEGQVGAPCEANEDCETAYCMTTDGIAGFIQGAVVPNGYCSALFCEVGGGDAVCTAAAGGVCFSLYAFLGEGLGEQGGICLRPCEGDADCRAADDNVCFDAAALVADGLLSQDVLDRYYGDETRGCLPQTVVDAAITKLTGP